MSKTFDSFSFGCRVNQAEKEELNQQLIASGFQYTQNYPSFYIINTCAVTQKAEREARQLIYQIKRKWPKTKIIVTGCAATKWIKEGVKIEGIERMIDNVNKEYIANIISKLKYQISKPQLKSQNLNFISRSTDTTDKFLSSGRLLLKIQDGCLRFCTFCIVPYLRGQPKSERIKNLESKIKNYENFINEVILTAINTQAYGYDTGESFVELVKTIINNTKVARISFGSIHPWTVDDKFFNFYKNYISFNRLVNFFHIPLQSGSNKILSHMRRGYSREEFTEKLNILHKINPNAFIGTDIIVGFLDETDRDFENTYNFLKNAPISKFHIFRFSPREKTAAFYMRKKLKEPQEEIKIKRAKILAQLSKRKYQQFLLSQIGRKSTALFLERRTNGFQQALLDNQIPILVKVGKNLCGFIKHVQVKQIKKDKLIGHLIE